MRFFLYLSFLLLQRCLSLSNTNPQQGGMTINDANLDFTDKMPAKKTNCTDEDCKHMGLLIKYSIKKSVPACEDFYTHACGGWISRTPFGGRSIVDQYTSIKMDMYNDLKGYLTDHGPKYQSYVTSKKARKFYESCTNALAWRKTGLTNLRKMVNRNGGWPLFNVNETEMTDQIWQNVHKRYSMRYDIAALFYLQVEPNRQNRTNHIITLTMPSLDKHDLVIRNAKKRRRFDPNDPECAYGKLIKEVADLVINKNPSRDVSRAARKRIRSMILFEEQLEKLGNVHFESNFHNYSSYRVTTIKELQIEWDTFWADVPSKNPVFYEMNWLETIRSIFAKAKAPVAIDENEAIAIEPGHYITYLAGLLNNTEPATIVNYIHWTAIKRMLKYSGKQIKFHVQHYKKVVYGTDSEDPRWLECIQDFPLEHLLVARIGHTDELRIQQKVVQNMFYDIEGEFAMDIVKSKLPTYERFPFIDKFTQSMNLWVGFPDWSRDVNNATLYYKSLRVDRNNHFINILRYNKFLRRKEFAKLRLPVDRLTAPWPVSTLDFVAAYDDRTNTVVLPAGLLKHPYMSFHKVPAIQYGALGSIIGHEMAHSIDNEERLFEGSSDRKKWWNKQISSKYKKVEECYRKEYDGFKIELGTGETLPINMNLTMREIIADNMGFRMAFRAFEHFRMGTEFDIELPDLLESGYSQEQIFFYSLAQSFCENPSDEYLRNVCATDEHPPSKIRINGALAGMKEFHDAFQCKNGDRMKMQESKCSVW